VPIHDLVPGDAQTAVPVVRTEPVQERGAARVEALLDAAAAVVDEVGFDRLTTAMVAEHAGSSIGTVYRYFPDRIALLQGLRDRAVQRYRIAVVETLRAGKPATWIQAIDLAMEAFVELFRSEPGFRIIRFFDVQRSPGDSSDEYDVGYFAAKLGEILSDTYGLPAGDELDFRMAIAVELGESLVDRAFLIAANGDERFIAEAHAVVRAYLGSYYGEKP
jgi:AcrR family transcriptional regulator